MSENKVANEKSKSNQLMLAQLEVQSELNFALSNGDTAKVIEAMSRGAQTAVPDLMGQFPIEMWVFKQIEKGLDHSAAADEIWMNLSQGAFAHKIYIELFKKNFLKFNHSNGLEHRKNAFGLLSKMLLHWPTQNALNEDLWRSAAELSLNATTGSQPDTPELQEALMDVKDKLMNALALNRAFDHEFDASVSQTKKEKLLHQILQFFSLTQALDHQDAIHTETETTKEPLKAQMPESLNAFIKKEVPLSDIDLYLAYGFQDAAIERMREWSGDQKIALMGGMSIRPEDEALPKHLEALDLKPSVFSLIMGQKKWEESDLEDLNWSLGADIFLVYEQSLDKESRPHWNAWKAALANDCAPALKLEKYAELVPLIKARAPYWLSYHCGLWKTDADWQGSPLKKEDRLFNDLKMAHEVNSHHQELPVDREALARRIGTTAGELILGEDKTHYTKIETKLLRVSSQWWASSSLLSETLISSFQASVGKNKAALILRFPRRAQQLNSNDHQSMTPELTHRLLDMCDLNDHLNETSIWDREHITWMTELPQDKIRKQLYAQKEKEGPSDETFMDMLAHERCAAIHQSWQKWDGALAHIIEHFHTTLDEDPSASSSFMLNAFRLRDMTEWIPMPKAFTALAKRRPEHAAYFILHSVLENAHSYFDSFLAILEDVKKDPEASEALKTALLKQCLKLKMNNSLFRDRSASLKPIRALAHALTNQPSERMVYEAKISIAILYNLSTYVMDRGMDLDIYPAAKVLPLAVNVLHQMNKNAIQTSRDRSAEPIMALRDLLENHEEIHNDSWIGVAVLAAAQIKNVGPEWELVANDSIPIVVTPEIKNSMPALFYVPEHRSNQFAESQMSKVQLLLKMGADINGRGVLGRTALECAIAQPNSSSKKCSGIETIKALLKLGADPSLMNPHQMAHPDALTLSCGLSRQESATLVVKTLLPYAKPGEGGALSRIHLKNDLSPQIIERVNDLGFASLKRSALISAARDNSVLTQKMIQKIDLKEILASSDEEPSLMGTLILSGIKNKALTQVYEEMLLKEPSFKVSLKDRELLSKRLNELEAHDAHREAAELIKIGASTTHLKEIKLKATTAAYFDIPMPEGRYHVTVQLPLACAFLASAIEQYDLGHNTMPYHLKTAVTLLEEGCLSASSEYKAVNIDTMWAVFMENAKDDPKFHQKIKQVFSDNDIVARMEAYLIASAIKPALSSEPKEPRKVLRM